MEHRPLRPSDSDLYYMLHAEKGILTPGSEIYFIPEDVFSEKFKKVNERTVTIDTEKYPRFLNSSAFCSYLLDEARSSISTGIAQKICILSIFYLVV